MEALPFNVSAPTLSRCLRHLPTLVLTAALTLSCRPHAEQAVPPHRPIILITIDTLRADHLPMYGNREVATPALERFAREALLFENAYSNCPLTLPSHATILTGLLPPSHAVRDNAGFALDVQQHPTLASLLHARGYATGAAVSSYVLRRGTGIAEGFDFYDDSIPYVDSAPAGELQRDGTATEAEAEKWIAAHSGSPFFFWLHLYDPHTPYAPPEPFRSRYKNPYDGEIAKSDAIVGKLLDFLRQRKLYDDAIIVIASDHGEGLMDHGEEEHGVFLYREALRVPLLIHAPSLPARRIATPVQLADVAPTILQLAGETASGMDGKNLLRDLPPRALYAESYYPRFHLGWSELRSMVDSREQYVAAPHSELYDLTTDPAERHNIIADDRRNAARLSHELEQYKGASPSASISKEEAARLASLGYVSATTTPASGPLPDPKERIGQLARVKEASRLTHGDPHRAIALLEELVAANPDWSDLRDQLGAAYERTGQLALAEATYRKAIVTTPSLASQFALSLASVLAAEGRFDEAVQHATLALHSSPAEAHQTLGEIAMARGDLASARREAEEAGRFPSEKMLSEFLLAQIDVAEQHPEAALPRLENIQHMGQATHTPLPKHYWFVSADAVARQGRTADAEALFRRAIASEPEERQAYANLALLRRMAGDPAGARAVLQQMIAANDNRASREFAVESLRHWGDDEGARQFAARSRK
jgi:tetratricopeptide (TPR) repeat protein